MIGKLWSRLFNRDEVVQVKTPTLEDFIEFARTKSGEYDYAEAQSCPFAQYLKSLGYTWVTVCPHTYTINIGNDYETRSLKEIHRRLNCCLNEVPYTWEALTERLEKLS